MRVVVGGDQQGVPKRVAPNRHKNEEGVTVPRNVVLQTAMRSNSENGRCRRFEVPGKRRARVASPQSRPTKVKSPPPKPTAAASDRDTQPEVHTLPQAAPLFSTPAGSCTPADASLELCTPDDHGAANSSLTAHARRRQLPLAHTTHGVMSFDGRGPSPASSGAGSFPITAEVQSHVHTLRSNSNVMTWVPPKEKMEQVRSVQMQGLPGPPQVTGVQTWPVEGSVSAPSSLQTSTTSVPSWTTVEHHAPISRPPSQISQVEQAGSRRESFVGPQLMQSLASEQLGSRKVSCICSQSFVGGGTPIALSTPGDGSRHVSCMCAQSHVGGDIVSPKAAPCLDDPQQCAQDGALWQGLVSLIRDIQSQQGRTIEKLIDDRFAPAEGSGDLVTEQNMVGTRHIEAVKRGTAALQQPFPVTSDFLADIKKEIRTATEEKFEQQQAHLTKYFQDMLGEKGQGHDVDELADIKKKFEAFQKRKHQELRDIQHDFQETIENHERQKRALRSELEQTEEKYSSAKKQLSGLQEKSEKSMRVASQRASSISSLQSTNTELSGQVSTLKDDLKSQKKLCAARTNEMQALKRQLASEPREDTSSAGAVTAISNPNSCATPPVSAASRSSSSSDRHLTQHAQMQRLGLRSCTPSPSCEIPMATPTATTEFTKMKQMLNQNIETKEIDASKVSQIRLELYDAKQTIKRLNEENTLKTHELDQLCGLFEEVDAEEQHPQEGKGVSSTPTPLVAKLRAQLAQMKRQLTDKHFEVQKLQAAKPRPRTPSPSASTTAPKRGRSHSQRSSAPPSPSWVLKDAPDNTITQLTSEVQSLQITLQKKTQDFNTLVQEKQALEEEMAAVKGHIEMLSQAEQAEQFTEGEAMEDKIFELQTMVTTKDAEIYNLTQKNVFLEEKAAESNAMREEAILSSQKEARRFEAEAAAACDALLGQQSKETAFDNEVAILAHQLQYLETTLLQRDDQLDAEKNKHRADKAHLQQQILSLQDHLSSSQRQERAAESSLHQIERNNTETLKNRVAYLESTLEQRDEEISGLKEGGNEKALAEKDSIIAHLQQDKANDGEEKLQKVEAENHRLSLALSKKTHDHEVALQQLDGVTAGPTQDTEKQIKALQQNLQQATLLRTEEEKTHRIIVSQLRQEEERSRQTHKIELYTLEKKITGHYERKIEDMMQAVEATKKSKGGGGGGGGGAQGGPNISISQLKTLSDQLRDSAPVGAIPSLTDIDQARNRSKSDGDCSTGNVCCTPCPTGRGGGGGGGGVAPPSDTAQKSQQIGLSETECSELLNMAKMKRSGKVCHLKTAVVW